MSSDSSNDSGRHSGTNLPILDIQSSDLPARVLVIGDLTRADTAASLLGACIEVGRNREYVTYCGSYDDVPVAVVSQFF